MADRAAERAAQTVTNMVLECVEGINAPEIITQEYRPLVEAARRVRELLGQALGANPGRSIDWNQEIALLEKAIEEVS